MLTKLLLAFCLGLLGAGGAATQSALAIQQDATHSKAIGSD